MTLRTLWRAVKARVPWWAKMSAKIVMSRFPVPYRLWKWLGLFEHGHMEDPAYALQVVRQHLRAVAETGVGSQAHFMGRATTDRPFTVLELGPGDSIFGGMAARALGAERVILVDTGPYARIDAGTSSRMAAHLAAQGLSAPEVTPDASPQDVLTAYGVEYHVAGLQSLRELPAGSVDLVFSQAVLEHIRRAEFEPTARELRRLLSATGTCSHVVDLMDHLGGSLNNLRFGPDLWESAFMADAGFYTNRLRQVEMLGVFAACGFAVQSVEIRRWPAVPIRRRALHATFRGFDDDELRISGFRLVLRPV